MTDKKKFTKLVEYSAFTGRVKNKICPNPNCNLPVKGMKSEDYARHSTRCANK